MKNRVIVLLTFCLLSLGALWAQVAEPSIVNMGEVLFQQPKEATFLLRNTAKEPMTITAVQASCGCTQMEWPQEPIAAGDTATIKVVFDAQLLGSFQKEIEVWTSNSEAPVVLTLQGRVVSTASDDDGDFPFDLGTVRLSTNMIEFDDVNRGGHPETVLRIMNTGRESYKPQLMHLPGYLTATYLPEQLAGGRVGQIILTLDSEQLKDYGLTQTSIYLARYLGDKVSSENEIGVSAVLLPGFSHLTAEQRRSAPRLALSATSIDFSDIGSKKKMTKSIVVANTGRRPLTVSRLQVYGKALTVSLSNRVVRPGGEVRLKVTVEAEELRREKGEPRVLLITDDPLSPKTVITLKH